LFRGFYTSDDGFKIPAHGSFITASLVMSLLVIPVIARSTVEGFRSIPREMREGSVALGATEGHGFLFLLFPWAIPNIITGLLLGCAEAAGSVTVILFIAGSGEFGVGPRNEATSLSYLVYYASRGDKEYLAVMGQYQYTAALMLLFLTFGLSILALLLKQRFGARYRGGISS
jgi:ABC-type phosphate transport system permease subunit